MKNIDIKLFSAVCGLAFLLAVMFTGQQSPASVIPDEIERAFTEDFMNVEPWPQPSKLPAFTYADLTGQEYSSESMAGPITVINLWATFCTPCITELPSLKALDDQFEEVRVIPISLDPVTEPDKIQTFMDQNKIHPFAGYWDNKREIRTSIAARGLPTTLIADEYGRILYRFEGEGDWASPAAIEFFKALLTVKK